MNSMSVVLGLSPPDLAGWLADWLSRLTEWLATSEDD